VLTETPFASRALGTLPNVMTQANLSASIGTLALFTAITGLCTRGMNVALGAVALLGIGWAFMPPGAASIFSLPGLRLVLPMYAWPLIVLPLTQAVGDGLAALGRPREWRRVGLALGCFVAAGVTIQLLRNWTTAVWLAPAACASLALTACLALQRARRGTAAIAGLVTLMIAEQIWTIAPFLVHPRSRVLTDAPSPAVQFLQSKLSAGDARFAGIPLLVGTPVSPMLFGLPDLRNLSALPVRRHLEYMRAIGPQTGDFTTQAVTKTRSPLLDLAAVRYFVFSASAPSLAGDPSMRRVYGDDRVVVYENTAALPRVRAVHQAVHVPNEASAAERLNQLASLPKAASELGLDKVVLLEPDDRGNEPPSLTGGASPGETVRIVEHDDPDRLVISAELQSAGFVVIADTYYPGWKAWVDGQRTAVYPAHLLFRAVHVPAGAHTVELRYQPASFLYGLVLAAVAGLLCLLVLFIRAGSAGGSPAS
jgi:hypothetical protein